MFIKKFDKNNNKIYWGLKNGNVKDNDAYLLLIDLPEKSLRASLSIADYASMTPRFALSRDDSLIYVFLLNESCWDNADYGEVPIPRPNIVKIYSARDLTLRDSIRIADPPSDSSCASMGYDVYDSNICAREGKYLIYFFSGFNGLERFVPALLFIFDTRTNEATWLRVGWR